MKGQLTYLILGLCCISLGGCGGGETVSLGQVTGIVTLDGEPLPGAIVSFSPVEGGRTSVATCDESGAYVMMYVGQKGALLGQHVVTISHIVDGKPNGVGPEGEEVFESIEMVPEKYRSGKELKAEVLEGPNEHNFVLSSK